MTTEEANVKCPKCEADNSSDAILCSSCGADMVPPPPKKKRFNETHMTQVPPPDLSKYIKKPGER
jgi:ribosomal protein L40E